MKKYLILLTNINLKWIKDLNRRPDSIKLLEENVGKKPLEPGAGNDFLNMIPRTQATKASNELHQMKNSA